MAKLGGGPFVQSKQGSMDFNNLDHLRTFAQNTNTLKISDPKPHCKIVMYNCKFCDSSPHYHKDRKDFQTMFFGIHPKSLFTCIQIIKENDNICIK